MKSNIFEVLARFRAYSPEDSNECNLAMLKNFINGYEIALLQYDIEEAGASFTKDFTDFLKVKYQIPKARLWAEILEKQYDQKPELCWAGFFLHLDEYRESLNSL